MKNSKWMVRGVGVPAMVVLLAAMMLAGCKSKMDQALEQAKQQAVTTGQPQQVVSVDKNGVTTTTVVEVPAAGQKNAIVTTTQTPPMAGSPIPAAAEPRVYAVPPPPVPLNATIVAGTSLAIRIDQRLSVKTSRSGDRFTGEFVEPIVGDDNVVLVPKGSQVDGVVVVSHKRGHFKGSSLLELRLTALTVNGTNYPLATRDLARTKKGKGKRSAAFIGGGAGLGMLVGGIASGGVGLVVGGLVGGGAGTAVAGLTGNRDIDMPAESIVHFKLAEDLVVMQPTK